MDAGRSLFVVVSYDGMDPYICSILQLETQLNNYEHKLSPFSSPASPMEFSAHFRLPQPHPQPQMPIPIIWAFSPLASSTEASFTEDLYMVPDRFFSDAKNNVPMHGCIFNLRTKKCKRIKPPKASKYLGHVVTLGGHIYFMAHPYWGNYAPDPIFERYNPLKDLWEELEPFPHRAIHRCEYHRGNIVATAVWDDTILLNIDGREIWAYNVGRNKWYPVNVKHDRCYSIEGEAVVLENTIYALAYAFELLVALSIKREEINGDLVFECSLLSEILVPGMEKYEFEVEEAYERTKHLVHLGKDNFCLVQSCIVFGVHEYQYIQLTNIKLKGENSMTVTNKCVHKFEISQDKQFNVSLCFSLPECKTTALKESKKRCFKLNPFPKRFAPKLEDKTDFNTEPKVVKPVQEEGIVTLPKDGPLFNVQATSELGAQSNYTISAVTGHPSHGYAKPSFAPKASTLGDGAASERSNTDEEGHSIYVRNLPRNATVRQLVKGLMKYGPIKRDGIQVRKNKTQGKCYAFVEFESATSKRHAIAASPIIIRGCSAEIEEKRRTGITQVDCNRTSGSSFFGKNKFKNHGEVSRSKTTSGGHNGGEGGGYLLNGGEGGGYLLNGGWK